MFEKSKKQLIEIVNYILRDRSPEIVFKTNIAYIDYSGRLNQKFDGLLAHHGYTWSSGFGSTGIGIKLLGDRNVSPTDLKARNIRYRDPRNSKYRRKEMSHGYEDYIEQAIADRLGLSNELGSRYGSTYEDDYTEQALFKGLRNKFFKGKGGKLAKQLKKDMTKYGKAKQAGKNDEKTRKLGEKIGKIRNSLRNKGKKEETNFYEF